MSPKKDTQNAAKRFKGFTDDEQFIDLAVATYERVYPNLRVHERNSCTRSRRRCRPEARRARLEGGGRPEINNRDSALSSRRIYQFHLGELDRRS